MSVYIACRIFICSYFTVLRLCRLSEVYSNKVSLVHLLFFVLIMYFVSLSDG